VARRSQSLECHRSAHEDRHRRGFVVREKRCSNMLKVYAFSKANDVLARRDQRSLDEDDPVLGR
jgi:hypothetical protein